MTETFISNYEFILVDLAEKIEELLEKKDTIKVATHRDADGISSAVLFTEYLKSIKPEVKVDVWFPEFFGYIDGDEDVILDMYPKGEKFRGIVIDHHSYEHEEAIKRNPHATFISGNVPTGLMVYQLFEGILRGNWKVVVSLVGDGQPERIPVEIWQKYPELRKTKVCYVYRKGSQTTIYRDPIWQYMSGGINALCKTNRPELAYQYLLLAKKPLDLIQLEKIREAITEKREEVDKVMKRKDKYGVLSISDAIYFEFESDFDIQSDIANILSRDERGLVVVVNRKTGKGSIRGVLAYWIKTELEKRGLNVGGHYGYVGITLMEEGQLEKLKRVLEEVL